MSVSIVHACMCACVHYRLYPDGRVFALLQRCAFVLVRGPAGSYYLGLWLCWIAGFLQSGPRSLDANHWLTRFSGQGTLLRGWLGCV